MTGAGLALTLPTTADGRPILAREDLERYDPRPTRAGGRERYYCPVHGGDHQRSLSLDPTSGLYTCHTCHVRGQLRDFWPERTGQAQVGRGRRPVLSAEERGRRVLAQAQRAAQERRERLAAAALPSGARSFLERLPAMVAALRRPECPGALYLRRRGLDPLRAADLGAGYAPAETWPGDHGRKVGRLVFPLADPLTGRVVSAVGRLCLDADRAWTGEQHSVFRRVKQRKLAGCPAGVWPYQSIAAARASGCPLVLVEGPADALALLQYAPRGRLHAVALLGTANVLPADALRPLPGVVLALDADGPGAAAARALRAGLAIAGVPVQVLPSGWLGCDGAKDPGDLAERALADPAAQTSYAGAVERVRAACLQLQAGARAGAAPPTEGRASDVGRWDDDAACALLSALYRACAELTAGLPADGASPRDAAELDARVDAAADARDWTALQAAAAAYRAAVTQHVAAWRETDGRALS